VAAKARGEESPSESESTGVDGEDEGGLFPDPTFHPPKTFPRLVTSSPNRRGSPFLLNGQNITGQMPGLVQLTAVARPRAGMLCPECVSTLVV
jgi:hypothetical protein